MDKAQATADSQAIREVIEKFLQAIVDREDWRPFAQRTFRDSKAFPNMPQFIEFEVGRTQKMQGANAAVMKAVYVKLRLVPSGHLGMRWIEGRLTVIKEADAYEPSPDGDWGCCPTSWRVSDKS